MAGDFIQAVCRIDHFREKSYKSTKEQYENARLFLLKISVIPDNIGYENGRIVMRWWDKNNMHPFMWIVKIDRNGEAIYVSASIVRKDFDADECSWFFAWAATEKWLSDTCYGKSADEYKLNSLKR